MRDEAASWAEEIVDSARATRHRRLAVLLTWAASSAWGLGRLDEAKRFGEEAIALADDADFDPFVWAFTDLAFVALLQGDIGRAIEIARAGAVHVTDRRDRFCLANQLYILALAGQTDEARAIADGVVAATEAAGVPSSIGLAFTEAAIASDRRATIADMSSSAWRARLRPLCRSANASASARSFGLAGTRWSGLSTVSRAWRGDGNTARTTCCVGRREPSVMGNLLHSRKGRSREVDRLRPGKA